MEDHKIDQPLISVSVRSILKALGLNDKSQHFIGTPQRVARMYAELCFMLTPQGEAQVQQIFRSVFESDNKELIITKDIRSTSLCPHHLLPVEYTSHAGYIADGKVIGLSKIPRLFKLLSAQPIIQEDLTSKIGKMLMEKLAPKGVMVVMSGAHACMRSRGVHEDGATITTSFVDGIFRDTSERSREEFLTLIRLR